jgi:hypothetical protein
MTDRQAGVAIVGTVVVCYADALTGVAAPWPWYLVNIALHAVASVLVWRLAQRLLPSPGAVIAALWFGVQPVHVDAVASLGGRADLITTIILLAILLAILRWGRVRQPPPALALVAAASVLAHGRATVAAWGSMDHWLTMCAAVPQYVRLMLVPVRLLVDYGPNVVRVEHAITGPVIVGLLGIAACGALVAVSWKRAPVVAFGLLWCAIAIGLSDVILSERMLYLPSVGVALVVGWVGAHLLAARATARIAPFALGAAGLLLAARTVTRVPFWHSNKTVLVGALHDEPESYRVHMLAGMVMVRGQHWPEASAQYARAIAIAPTEAAPWLRLAEVRGAAGDWRGAMAGARRAYTLAPDSLRAVQMVQIAGRQLGDTAVVDTTFQQALHDHPRDPRLRFVYAMMLRDRGDTAAATRIGLPGLGSLLKAAP